MDAAARFRGLLGSALLVAPWLAGHAAETPVRAAPSRPGSSATVVVPPALPLAGKKIGRTDYVAVGDVARRLGLKLVELEPGRKVSLADPSARIELESETRDITVNGLRVFLGDPVANVGGQLYVSRVDYERCLAPMVRPGHEIAARPAPKVIVLDPGHGGSDPGKTKARMGIDEKSLVLDVARRSRKLLEASGYRVVLTREDDSFVPLPQRAAIANVAHADLFVSIHFNALPNDTKTSGVEVYTFAPRFQRSTNAWGLLEKNDAEDQASPGNRYDHWNVALAHALHRRLVSNLRAADRGKKLMHLAVLRPLNCPGVLVECGFLTSDEEARKIATPDYRQRVAAALAAGIQDYAASLEGVRRSATPVATAP